MELVHQYTRSTQEVIKIVETIFRELPEKVLQKNPNNKITALKYSWQDDNLNFSFEFNFNGIQVSGNVEINENEKKVTLKISLPFYLKMFGKENDVRNFFNEMIQEYNL